MSKRKRVVPVSYAGLNSVEDGGTVGNYQNANLRVCSSLFIHSQDGAISSENQAMLVKRVTDEVLTE